jgi:hypothetical protein
MDEKRRIPLLHFPHVSNLLACYVRKTKTPPTSAHLSSSYVISFNSLEHLHHSSLPPVFPLSPRTPVAKDCKPNSHVPSVHNMAIIHTIAQRYPNSNR